MKADAKSLFCSQNAVVMNQQRLSKIWGENQREREGERGREGETKRGREGGGHHNIVLFVFLSDHLTRVRIEFPYSEHGRASLAPL